VIIISIFSKKSSEEIIVLEGKDEKYIFNIKVYNPIYWKAILKAIQKCPENIKGLFNNKDGDNTIYMRFRKNGKRHKIVEFPNKKDCESFFGILNDIIKGDASVNFDDDYYIDK